MDRWTVPSRSFMGLATNTDPYRSARVTPREMLTHLMALDDSHEFHDSA